MSAQGTYRFYSFLRQTILLVNGEPLGQERVNNVKNYVPIKCNACKALGFNKRSVEWKQLIFVFFYIDLRRD